MVAPSLRCAVITPVAAGAESLFDQTAESITLAVTRDRGVFDDVNHLRIDDPKGTLGSGKTRALGLEEARAAGADWIFFADAGTVLMPDVFRLAAPAMGAYDAVWGSSCVIDPEKGEASIIRESISAFSELPVLVRRLQDYWFGFPHFVRLEAAAAVGFDDNLAGQASEISYVLDLWRRYRCLKTAQPYAATIGNWPTLDQGAQLVLARAIDSGDVMIDFSYRGATVKLPFTGRNAIIENIQLRGQFFEQVALEYLADHCKPGSVIVDVGANTGNHTVYFAQFMEAAKVIPIEPNPDAIRALQAAVTANEVDNVDQSLLGIGLGDAEGRFSVSTETTLGSVQLAADPDGLVEVKPLDRVISGDVDLIKIDVEDMEIEVLMGARETIKRCRPLIYIEVLDKNIGPFLELVRALNYRVDRIFPEFTFANYVLMPNE